MTMHRALPLLATALALAGCKDRRDDRPTLTRVGPRDAAVATHEPPPLPPDPIPGAVDPAILDGARTIAGSREIVKVDATAAGTTVELRLLTRLGAQTPAGRELTVLLALRGTTAIVVELGPTTDRAQPDHTIAPPLTLLEVKPITPPRPWQPDDAGFGEPTLAARGNLRFLYRAAIGGSAETFAVVEHPAGRLTAYSIRSDNDQSQAPAWRQLSVITAAPGAILATP